MKKFNQRHANEQETHSFEWKGGPTSRVAMLMALHEFGVSREQAMAICGGRRVLILTTAEASSLERLLTEKQVIKLWSIQEL